MDDTVDTIKIDIPNKQRDDKDGRRREGNNDVVTYCTVDNLVQLKDKERGCRSRVYIYLHRLYRSRSKRHWAISFDK